MGHFLREFHEPDRYKYEVAILCALKIESTAVEACFDEVFDSTHCGIVIGKSNAYTFGRIGQHYVVLIYLSSIGKVGSATAGKDLETHFPNIKLSLLVGICGSVPCRQEDGTQVDIMLGDVIISTGVVQYDLARQYDNGHPVRKATTYDNLSRQTPALRSWIHKLQAGLGASDLRTKAQQYLTDIHSKGSLLSYARPPVEDVLYPADYLHKHRPAEKCAECDRSEFQSCEKARSSTCEELGCEIVAQIKRVRRSNDEFALPQPSDIHIHWGLMASGDSVMKSGRVRDDIAGTEEVIAFEMEGSGLWEVFPTIIVKGVCDYADSHKNKGWQKYSALTAAATTKALLMKWPSSAAVFEQSGWDVPAGQHRSTLTSDSLSRQNTAIEDCPVWMVPFDRRAAMVGRIVEKEQIENLLFSGTTCNIVAIDGLGGMGKSRLALEVAYSIQAERSVFWIQCSDIPSFERDCRGLAQALAVPGAEDFSRDPKALMKQHLDQDKTSDWLLILDSADNEQFWSARAATLSNSNALINYIPRGRRGAVLITTANHKIASDTAQKNVVKLAQLSPKDSKALFQSLLQVNEPDSNNGAVSQLLDHLAHLPLAIVQAAAFINQNSQSIRDYLEIWKDSSEDEIVEILSKDFTDDTRYQNAGRPVAKTWIISFRNIDAQYPLAAKLLSYMSCLDHKDMLKSCIPPLIASPLEQLEAFGTLKGYAFIQSQQRDTSDTVFDMHRLVHLVTRNYLRQQKSFADTLRTVAQHLRTQVPEARIENSPYWQLYLPHVERVISTNDIENETCYFELLELLSRVHYANAAYAKALKYRRTLIGKLSSQSVPNELRRINNFVALADILRQLGKTQEAMQAAEHAYQLSNQKLPSDCSNNVIVMECLAKTHGMFGNYEKALQLSKDTVRLARNCKYATKDLQVRTTMSALYTLSLCHSSLRQYRDQEEKLIEAIELAKRLKSDIEKAEYKLALATVKSLLGRANAAVKILVRLREVLEKKFDGSHRLTLGCISRLAEIYRHQGRDHDAELLYREVLDKYTRAGRRDDLQVLYDRMELASIVSGRGDHAEAERILLETIGLTTPATGKNSEITLECLQRLATTYWYMRKYNWAIAMMSSCYERSKTIPRLGPEHAVTLERLETEQRWRCWMQLIRLQRTGGKFRVMGI